MALVTLDQARTHLKILTSGSPPASADDAEIAEKLAQAEALVLDYVDQRRLDGDTWSEEVASWDVTASPPVDPPAVVVAAVLVQLGYLWRYHGDDLNMERPPEELGELPRAVTALLHRLRDPALA